MAKTKINWTDKVQAIAAVIAILGGIAGFIKLFSTDHELQKQIDNLSIIANQSVIQTTIFQEQLNLLSERNRILIEQLDIDKDKWTKQIRPEFSIQLEKFSGGEIGESKSTYHDVPLINNGAAAFILRTEENDKNQCKIKIQPTFIPKQGSVLIDITFPNDNGYLDPGETADIIILFKNISNPCFPRITVWMSSLCQDRTFPKANKI